MSGVQEESVKRLPERAELPVESTWDLSRIFASEEVFEAACAEVRGQIEEAHRFYGLMGASAVSFLDGLERVLDVYRRLEPLYTFAHLLHDQDTADARGQELLSKVGTLRTRVGEAFSWVEPEILELSDEQIEAFFLAEPRLSVYRHYVDGLLRNRPHILSKKEELLLAGAGEILDSGADIFGVLNNADLVFPVVKDDEGASVQLSHGLYGRLMESTNREVRRGAFEGIYGVYRQFQNTLASTLSAQVKSHNFLARVRQFGSAREAALHGNAIDTAVYDTLVTVVHENLHLLQEYVGRRKELLGLDELHMYDLYTPLYGEPPVRYSYEEAKAHVLAALAPLGEEYGEVLRRAFSDRWIDVYENRGKRSGAYSAGCYDTDPYILLNWHDSLDQMFTLAHELGHSVHSYFSRKYQPFVYGDYSIFLAEIASTTNEILLTEYLLATQTDPAVRRYVVNHYLDGFKGTVFRQTQFAEFEHLIHSKEAEGVPLTAEFLCEAYMDLNRKYYGDEVISDPEIAFEWSRIPHFYYHYYVYQYATGFSAASALASAILEEGEPAVERYLGFLKAGSSEYPIEVMKRAGIDMTDAGYLRNAVKKFEKGFR